jgi:hypothetical protein
MTAQQSRFDELEPIFNKKVTTYKRTSTGSNV